MDRLRRIFTSQEDENVATTDREGEENTRSEGRGTEESFCDAKMVTNNAEVADKSYEGKSADPPQPEHSSEETQKTPDDPSATIRRLEEAATTWRQEAEKYRGHYEEAREQQKQESEEYDLQLRAAREELDGWRKRADDAERELSFLHEERKRTANLLEIRTGELLHAQTFLSTSDSVPPAQVLVMVDNLNTLSSQLASELTECTTFSGSGPPPSSSMKDTVRDWIGEVAVDALVSGSHQEDQTMVQVALFGAISRVAAFSMTHWSNPSRHGTSLLQNIHRDILVKEPQAVSARWRTLAHKSIRELYADVDVVSKSSQGLFELTMCIVQISGGEHSERYSNEETMKMIRDIITLCLDIKRVVTEEIMSTNLEVYCPLPGTQFSRTFMEDLDDDGSGKRKSGIPIMIPNEVGLIRRERAEGPDGRVTKHVMLKAKVLLAPPT